MDPLTSKKAIDVAKKGALAGLKALRHELARKRGDDALLTELGEADDAIVEAICVLAGQSDGLAAALATGLKGLIARPDLFNDGVPREWIRTQEVQDDLRALANAAIRGEDGSAAAARAAAHYELFDKQGGAPPAEDAIEEALDFVLRSLRRDLTTGDRLLLSAIASVKADTQRLLPPDTSVLADKEVRDTLDWIRRARFFISSDARSKAAIFGDALIEGNLRGASAGLRGTALAWVARVQSLKGDGPGPERYLKGAEALLASDDEILLVARAFAIGADDFENGLALLDPDASRIQATATFQILRLGLGSEAALERARKAGIDYAMLDPDGRYTALTALIELKRWDEALAAAKQLSDEDYAAAPALLWVVGTLLVASRTREDLRPLVLQQVPSTPAEFMLGTDSDSLEVLRQAASLMAEAATACDELRLPTEAEAARRYVLWLKLRDPEHRAGALEELKQKISGKGQIAWLPLALAFGLQIDVEEAGALIGKQLARNPNPSVEIMGALVALLLHHAVTDPKRGLAFLDEHRQLFGQFLSPDSMIGLEAKMLSDAGQKDEVRALIEVSADNFPPHLKSLLESEHQGDGKGASIEALEAAYAAAPETPRLFSLIWGYLRRDEPRPRLAELARILLADVPDVEVATEIIRRLAEQERDEEALGLLDMLGDASSYPPALLTIASWLHYRQGHFEQSERLLERLESIRDQEQDRRLRYQLLIATGRWEAVAEWVEQQWRKRAQRSAFELGQFAIISAQAGAKRTLDLARAAAEKGPEDPQALVAAYSALTTAGLEEDFSDSGRWIVDAAAHSTEEGPIRKASLKELLDGAPEWNKRVDTAIQALAAGKAPLDLIAKLLRRPWLELHLAALLNNPRISDPRSRRIVTLFSGRKSDFRDVPLEEREVSLDTSAIVTLAMADALEPVLQSFETVHVRHDVLSDLYIQQARLTFHQPSRIAFAKTLLELLFRKKVQPFQASQVPDISLVTDLGDDRAGMLAEAASASGGQHVFVHPFPIMRIGSLLTEPVALDEYRDQLVSCSAVVDALLRFGRLRREEADAALAYLSIHEERWPNEPAIAKGATLYLSDVAVSYFRYTKLLDRIVDAGLTPVISTSEMRDAQALLDLEASSTEVGAVLDKARAAISREAATGRIRFGAIDSKDDEEPEQSIGSLASRSTLLVSDDRFLNRFEHFDHDGGRSRISSSIDLLSQLAASGRFDRDQLASTKTRLREAGAIYVPVDRSDLSQLIATTTLETGADGESPRLAETGELRAFRENIRLAQARGWFNAPVDHVWLGKMQLALADVLIEQWKEPIDDELAAGRSAWLFNLIDFRDWADSVVTRNLDLAEFGMIIGVAKLASTVPTLEEDARARLNGWLDDEVVGPLFRGEPRLREPLLNHLRGLLRDIAGDDETRPEQVSERAAARWWFDGLSNMVQLGLLEDKEFASWIGFTLQSTLHVEQASFALPTLAKTVGKLYADPSKTGTIKDSDGKSWTVAADPKDELGLIFKHQKTDYRTRAIAGLLPTAEERLEAFDRRLRAEGVNPQALEGWREKLKAAPAAPQEVAEIETAIQALPPFAAGRITEALEKGGGERSAIVPRDKTYYERLVGKSEARTLEAFLEDKQRLEIDWVEAKPIDRAAWLMLRAAQPGILANSELNELGAGDRLQLGEWALTKADLLAKLAFIELALSHASDDEALETIILQLIEQILKLDPDDEEGPLYLMTALIIFADGEISQQSTLAAWPPFRRRQASIAHASLMGRIMAGEGGTKNLASFCLNQGGWRFAVQNLIDLRTEPRWRGDHISPGQLRYEMLGRVANVGGAVGDDRLPPRLRTLFRDEDSEFRKSFGIQMFFPGPLEGGTGNLIRDLPDEILDAIEKGLEAEPLTLEALNPLLNCNNMFRLPASLLERATARIQEAGPRLFGSHRREQVSAYLLALANLAAAERLVGLAEVIQILARHHRARDKVPAHDEATLALTAAASHEAVQKWREKVGQWMLELAANFDDREEVESLLNWVDTMSEIDPPLRAYTGRALATLRLFVGR